MSWLHNRPDNWVEISNEAVIDLKEQGIDFNPACFSAGVNAILKALRADGFHITTGQILEISGEKIVATKNNTLVLIPDEEKDELQQGG